MREGEAIESNMLIGQIERAQRKVEAHNFDARKSLLEYDDVANDQRRVIYQQRNQLMQTDDISESLAEIRAEVVNAVISEFIPPESVEEQWDVNGLSRRPWRASSAPRWMSSACSTTSRAWTRPACGPGSWRQWRNRVPEASSRPSSRPNCASSKSS